MGVNCTPPTVKGVRSASPGSGFSAGKDGSTEGCLLREDELVLGAENADADLHRVGIASVFLLGHAEVARIMQTEGIIEARQSAGIASREGNDVEIAALEDQPRSNLFAVGSSA